MITKFHALRCATIAISLSLTAGAVSAGVDIPCRTAKVIVPWGAGGGTDIVFRTYIEEVNKLGAKPKLQVVNIPGQSGNKGAKVALKAKADGCSLLAIHQSTITSYLNGQVNFSWDAFDPVARLTNTPSFIGATKTAPFDDIPSMIKHAKANPNTLVAASTLGSTTHFLMLMIEQDANIKFKHVSYDGTRQRLTALLAGNADLAEVNLTSARKNIESGDLKVLAVTTEQRNPNLPNVPTLRESHIDIVYGTQRGIALPKGASAELIAHYQALFEQASASASLIKSLAGKGTEVKYLNSEDYRSQLVDTTVLWEGLAKKVGIVRAAN